VLSALFVRALGRTVCLKPAMSRRVTVSLMEGPKAEDDEVPQSLRVSDRERDERGSGGAMRQSSGMEVIEEPRGLFDETSYQPAAGACLTRACTRVISARAAVRAHP
jgi:hypothetical protein